VYVAYHLWRMCMRFSIMRTFARLSAAVFTVCRGIVSICSLSNCAPSSSIMVAVLLLLLAVNERGAGSNELAQVGSGRYTCCWCGGGGAGGTRAVTSVSSSRMVDGGVVEGGVVALRLANSTNAKGAAACSYSLHLLVLVWLGLGSVVILAVAAVLEPVVPPAAAAALDDDVCFGSIRGALFFFFLRMLCVLCCVSKTLGGGALLRTRELARGVAACSCSCEEEEDDVPPRPIRQGRGGGGGVLARVDVGEMECKLAWSYSPRTPPLPPP